MHYVYNTYALQTQWYHLEHPLFSKFLLHKYHNGILYIVERIHQFLYVLLLFVLVQIQYVDELLELQFLL